ncbi:TonB family protein [Pontixanthobacter aestiaquae]|uniref:TonB family protein n=1 Tax=Pontixanthobacter aestiaquae TaxID=1509367 RepID=A0A844Z7J9_9SPHN|nr:energy transducer TonB [Pontixanthobacter aestiaquae]MDN3645950.1 TonB family protein [Pontixanthobacter aestiaquae]MXO83057.1 TonB family protein [Pontixanthobacter aestiaquae]
MAYVDQGGQANRKTAIAGVAVIHGVIGTVLVLGLANTVFVPKEDVPFEGTNIEVELPKPPPPEPKPDKKDRTPPRDDRIFIPQPINDIPTDSPVIDATDDPSASDTILDDLLPPAGSGSNAGTGLTPLPPIFDPVAAKPSNNSGLWVTNDDYRDSWINRGFEGKARFRVTIGTDGRVKDCQITTSTGHRALDRATCQLVKRRARFEPALNSNGEKVTDTYSKSILWQLPE